MTGHRSRFPRSLDGARADPVRAAEHHPRGRHFAVDEDSTTPISPAPSCRCWAMRWCWARPSTSPATRHQRRTSRPDVAGRGVEPRLVHMAPTPSPPSTRSSATACWATRRTRWCSTTPRSAPSCPADRSGAVPARGPGDRRLAPRRPRPSGGRRRIDALYDDLVQRFASTGPEPRSTEFAPVPTARSARSAAVDWDQSRTRLEPATGDVA